MIMERVGSMNQGTQSAGCYESSCKQRWSCGELSENQDASRKRTLTKMPSVGGATEEDVIRIIERDLNLNKVALSCRHAAILVHLLELQGYLLEI